MNDKDLVKEKILTKEEFFSKIENIVVNKCVTYLDALFEYCESNNIDHHDLSKLISKPFRAILESEANDLNLLKKKSNNKINF